MPKNIQTGFVGIRDNHNHYTTLCLLFSTCSRHAILGVFLTCMWKKFMFSLSVNFIIYDPHATQKGMYSACDYLLSLQILFVLVGYVHVHVHVQSSLFALVSEMNLYQRMQCISGCRSGYFRSNGMCLVCPENSDNTEPSSNSCTCKGQSVTETQSNTTAMKNCSSMPL